MAKGPLDESHPEVQALVNAGVSPERITALAQANGVSHPAIQGFTADPTDPTQYAADILTQAGLPNTAENEKLLETQMTEEGMPGSEDNPLATTVTEPGSKSINSAGVQAFPTGAEGVAADAQTLKQANMASIYKALQSGNATPQQYADALAASSYEGSSKAANAAYANAFLKDSGDPEQSFPTGGTSDSSSLSYGTQALTDAMSENPYASLANTIPTLGTQASNYALQSALSGLSAPAQTALLANTSQAPGSPDQTPSVAQQTTVNPASTYQAQLAAMLPGIKPGGSQ